MPIPTSSPQSPLAAAITELPADGGEHRVALVAEGRLAGGAPGWCGTVAVELPRLAVTAGSPAVPVARSEVELRLPARWRVTCWSGDLAPEGYPGATLGLDDREDGLSVQVTASGVPRLAGRVGDDGPGRWRLSRATRRLQCELRPAGSQVRAWGVNQGLRVELPAAGAGGTFAWSLEEIGGSVRATWALELRSAAPLHRIEAAVPAGWRMVAAEAGALALDLPPEDEVQAQPWPLAIGTVIIGGLALSTLLTLFVVPVLYVLVARFARPANAMGDELDRLERETPDRG